MGSSTGTSGRGESRSPQRSTKSSPPRHDSQTDANHVDASLKPESSNAAEPAKPLAPPPRPGVQQQSTTGNTPDYFVTQHGASAGSLSLEPNPFEQSFGGAPETPGGTKLPPVAALTSPSSLLPGTGVTPFAWGGGSLRTGPLSPAMLSGPTNDYFSDTHHIRGGFPTPNESSLRTGLTPGGSGSMFPAPSPNTQAMFAQLANSGATPGTLDFHRTAMTAAAAAKRDQHVQAQQSAMTSAPSDATPATAPVSAKPESKGPSGPFDPHDNDAANGLFMLAQGRNAAAQHPNPPYTMAPQQQIHSHPTAPPVQVATSVSPVMNGHAARNGSMGRGVSEAGSNGSEESEPMRPNTRGKGKRNSSNATATTNGRRKAEDAPAKAPASKKAKTNGSMPSFSGGFPDDDEDMSDDDDDMKMGGDPDKPKSKMTDEEKRKNFLERNRVAALKCRQRKKQWLANLQQKVETYSSENDHLLSQISQLREEVVNLKTLLLAHKDCPVTQQQGLHGAYMQQAAMEPFNQQMNPYGMAAPIPNQAVMTGQPVNRRFS